MTSRLISYFPERVTAAAFFALWYLAPDPDYDVNKTNIITKQMLGYEAGGYQVFLGSEPDAADIISQHVCFSLLEGSYFRTRVLIHFQVDCLIPIIYPHNPKLWVTDMAPLGALRSWLTNKKTAPRPSYLSEQAGVPYTSLFSCADHCIQEYETLRTTLKSQSIAPPLNYYTIITSGVNAEDDKRAYSVSFLS